MNDHQATSETERIWRELSDRLRQFIRSRVQSTTDIEDILQTVFLRIHQSLDSLRSADRLDSWVFQITRNAIIDHFRRSNTAYDGDVETLAEPESQSTVSAELARCLVTLINQLPEAQKRAVSMYELEGVSQAQIAALESISLSAAKSRIQRGRLQLEKILRECCICQIDARGNVIEYEPQKGTCASDCRCADRQ